MLSVHVQKDISEYEPKLIGQLTARRLLSIVGAVGLPVVTGVYLVFVLGLVVDDFLVIFFIECIGFWMLGFWRPKAMDFEKWLPRYLTHRFGSSHVFYVSSLHNVGLMPTQQERPALPDKSWLKLAKSQKGIEKVNFNDL
jgi:hypothetical protein